MNQEIIRTFCLEKDPHILHKMTPTAKALLIDGCFSVLFQKFGDQELAAIALEELGEIKKLRYKANESEGKANFQKKKGLHGKAARTAWKKLSEKERLAYRPWVSSFVYTGKPMGGYQDLKRTGATIVKVINKKDLPKAREGFMAAARSFPEYKRNPRDPNQTVDGHPLVYALGGFAAFGNPASFHNPYVRQQRLTARKAVLSLFETVIRLMHDEKQRTKTKFQMVPDRMLYRHRSQAPSAESWHRDVTPAEYLSGGDEVYGGWLNLDLIQNQYLSFIPGSHLGVNLMDLREGFASLSDEAVEVVKPYRSRIAVPPGYALIFPQYILHEVVSTGAKYDMMRIFMGWRTTTSSDFLIPATRERMETQGIIPLPSGQEPPMYAANHGSFFRYKDFRPIPRIKDWRVSTIGWSNETFKEEGPTGVLITLPHQGKGDNPDYRLVSRYMSSLQHYGLPTYPPYTKEELDLYLPVSLTKKRVRVAFFDLDETLICQCAKLDTKETSLLPIYEDEEQGSTTYSTAAIMALLAVLTRDKDYLWYLVSRGRNRVKFQALQSFSKTSGIGVIAPDTVHGISQYGNEDKGATITKILEDVTATHTVAHAVFADDTEMYREQVREALGDTVEILDFAAYKGPECWTAPDLSLPLTFLNDDDVTKLTRILGVK